METLKAKKKNGQMDFLLYVTVLLLCAFAHRRQLLLRTEQGEPELRWIVLSEEPGKVHGHGAWRYDSDVTGGLSLS